MQTLFENQRFVKSLFVLVCALALYFAGQFVNGVKEYSFIGRDVPPVTAINVSGTGEAFSAPDIATITYSVKKEAKTVSEAQKLSAEKVNEILAFLKSSGVDEKDIQTTNYNLSPQYEYKTPTVYMNGYCPPLNPIIVGYTVSQSTSVKIRKIDDAGKILAGVGEKGATDIGNIELSVEKKDAVQDEARDKAIKDAQNKALVLAKSLGVRLTRLVSYSENGSSPLPYYEMGGMMKASADSAITPSISTGENKFTSNVSLVYEIQ